MSRLQAAVFQILEGFTLSDDVRKILEAAYYADDTFIQGRAAGLEEAAKQIWIECVAAADDNDLRIYTLLSELRKSILSLSPTSSDAGKDDARDAAWMEAAKRVRDFLDARETMIGLHEKEVHAVRARNGYFPLTVDDLRALSSLEVIGKGEKG